MQDLPACIIQKFQNYLPIVARLKIKTGENQENIIAQLFLSIFFFKSLITLFIYQFSVFPIILFVIFYLS